MPIFARIATNGIQLNVAQSGPEEGPLLIFLHGFPEFWYGWRHQIEHFAILVYRAKGNGRLTRRREGKYGIPSHLRGFA